MKDQSLLERKLLPMVSERSYRIKFAFSLVSP